MLTKPVDQTVSEGEAEWDEVLGGVDSTLIHPSCYGYKMRRLIGDECTQTFSCVTDFDKDRRSPVFFGFSSTRGNLHKNIQLCVYPDH